MLIRAFPYLQKIPGNIFVSDSSKEKIEIPFTPAALGFLYIYLSSILSYVMVIVLAVVSAESSRQE